MRPSAGKCKGLRSSHDARIVEQEWQHFAACHAKYAAPDSPEWVTDLFQVTERIYRHFHADPAAAREEIAHWQHERDAQFMISAFLADAPDDLRDATRQRLPWFGRRAK